MKNQLEVNVAPSSTTGHFVKGAKEVIALDELMETFYVKGESQLVTKNHTTLELENQCLITCQQIYNPYLKMFEKSKD